MLIGTAKLRLVIGLRQISWLPLPCRTSVHSAARNTSRSSLSNCGAIHAAVTDDLVRSGRRAGDLVGRLAAVSGGKGGGRPHFASAGAGDRSLLAAARAQAPAIVAEWLQGKS